MTNTHDNQMPTIPLDELPLSDPPAPAPPKAHLAWIVRDAAKRAADLLSGVAPIAEPRVDLVRLLSDTSDANLAHAAAENAGLRSAELARLRTAFTFNGLTGVHVTLQPIEADSETMEAAASAIESARPGIGISLRVAHNWITDDTAKLQVRLGPDGRWYPFTATTDDNWAPVRNPSASPAAAYINAADAKRNRAS